MARTIGPLMSLDASGSLAKTIVFSKWKGRNYVRQHVTPANPRSAAQTGMRSMFSFLAQIWATIAAGEQATWQGLADVGNYSTFNAYMKENQARWRDFLAPSEEYPVPGGGTPSAIADEAATASGRNILLEGTTGAGADQWGVMIFRTLGAAFTTNWDNCIAIIPVAASLGFAYTDGPLDADTYYYNFRAFTNIGDLGVEETEVSAVVT